MTRLDVDTLFSFSIGHNTISPENLQAESRIYKAVVETIRKTHPDWSSSGFICISDLNQFRANYVKNVLESLTQTFSERVFKEEIGRGECLTEKFSQQRWNS
jgi:hypothetical protein